MMHVRVLGAEGAGGAAEGLGQEAAVAAHAAHGRTRRLMRSAARAGGAACGHLAAPHSSMPRAWRSLVVGQTDGWIFNFAA
jgi:hypothetical protein